MTMTIPANPARAHRRLRVGLLLLLTLAATGCERYQVHERHGVFTLTAHMLRDKLDWEGGNTSLSLLRLCSSVDDTCIEGLDIRVGEPRPETRRHHRISVLHIPDEPGKDGAAGRLSFHDAVTGARLTCTDCSDDFEVKAAALRDYGIPQFIWGHTGDTGLAVFPAAAGEMRFVLVEFDATTYRVTPLGGGPAGLFQPASPEFGPDDGGVGWYVCDPACDLIAFDRQARTLTAHDLPCDDTTYLDIGWLGPKAYPQHYWSANTHTETLCLVDGRPALPRGPGETWAPIRDDDPPHPTDASALPPGRNIPLS